MVLAAHWAGLGIFFNIGQDCTAGSRVYVQDTVYDKFMELLLKTAKELVVSNGFDEKASAGPVVSKISMFVTLWIRQPMSCRDCARYAGVKDTIRTRLELH